MIVISAQAAGVQLARGEEAGSIYKYCTAPFRLCRSSFQFKEGIDRVALSRIGFRVDPTSNSPYLPLPVSFVSRSSFPSLPGHAAAASFAKARRFSGRISRLNIDREGKKEETEEGLRETFPLLSSPRPPTPSLPLPRRRQWLPRGEIPCSVSASKGSLAHSLACIHTGYTERERRRCRHQWPPRPLPLLLPLLSAAKSKVFRDHC